MANLDVAREAPTAANVTVKAPRDYLTEREVERLMDAARENRWGHRDATAILVAFRHGLRASELVGLRWDDIDWKTSTLHVRRAKGAYRHPAAIGREGTASAAPVAAGSLGRPHLRFLLGERWPSWLVATAAENRLSIRAAQFAHVVCGSQRLPNNRDL